jgi:cbb3-type cytochrome c oxidase subunit I/cbb3-type cytochrome c oxidase subunit II
MSTSEPVGRDFEIEQPIAPVEYGLVRAHALASLGGLVVAGLFGLIVATKFPLPDFLGQHAALSWGRLRMNHTQGVFFGFLGNAALAFAYYASPRLIGLPVTSPRLGWSLFFLWNLGIVLPGWSLVSAGILQPLEWAEFPPVVDAAVMVAVACGAIQFLWPTFHLQVDRLYISSWYLVGGFTFTACAYLMGNVAPLYYPGTQGAAFSGLWIHDAVGLFASPMALAAIYYIIPAVTRRPIFSHFLSLLGFWLLFFVYPLNGMHHYLLAPLPMDAQLGAIAASVYMGVNVVLVVTNLLLSLRGGTQMVGKDISLRFIVTSVILYLLAGLQGALMALLPLNRLTHFSDWVVGHSHLALLGFAGFAALGAIGHVWQHTPGARYSPRAMAWAYWLALFGLLFMVVDLTIVGLIQAHLWNLDLPWMTSVTESRPYWALRAVSGAMLLTGFVCFLCGLFTGLKPSERMSNSRFHDLEADLVVHVEHPALQGLRHPAGAALVAVALACFVGGLVFFAFSIVVLGIVPARQVAAEIADSTPAAWRPRTAAEERGREVYARQGCAYCHTQQVRAVEADVRRFGPATENWETREDLPHLWGTRRIGPDLAREAGRRPDDWQRVHLYNPRWVEPESVMPGYPWLFDGVPDRPTPEAKDLIAYLQWLGRPRHDRDFDAAEVTRAATARHKHLMGGMAMAEIAPISDGPAPRLDLSTAAGDLESGAEIFARRCSGCHGPAGDGGGKAAASLLPHPADLTAARVSSRRLADVLWNGVPGTAMPRFRDVPQRDLRAVASHVASLASGPPGIRDAAAQTHSSGVAGPAYGAVLFRLRCAICHGAEGRGDGPAAVRLRRPPADFSRKQPGAERVHAVLLHGIPGTAMTPMQQNLSESDRDALVLFVQSLFEERPQGASLP